MTIIKKTDHTNSYGVGEKIKRQSNFGKRFQFLKRLNIPLPLDSGIVLSIYLWAMKTYVHRKTCKWVLITTWLIITTNWKQSKCSSTSEWINLLWFVPTLVPRSAVEGATTDTCSNTDETQNATWGQDTGRRRLHVAQFCLHEIPSKGKTMETGIRSAVAWSWG